MGAASIKMYDKFAIVLRIETTANDVSFFKHHRMVEQRNGTSVFKLAPLKKSIYSLDDLRRMLAAANRRYIDFLSALDDSSAGTTTLNKLSETRTHEGRPYKAFNFFSADDQRLFEAILHGEHLIQGLRNSDLQSAMAHRSSGQISRLLKRLRIHGLIQRIGGTYKDYVTEIGRRVVIAGLKLKELFLVPALAA